MQYGKSKYRKKCQTGGSVSLHPSLNPLQCPQGYFFSEVENQCIPIPNAPQSPQGSLQPMYQPNDTISPEIQQGINSEKQDEINRAAYIAQNPGAEAKGLVFNETQYNKYGHYDPKHDYTDSGMAQPSMVGGVPFLSKLLMTANVVGRQLSENAANRRKSNYWQNNATNPYSGILGYNNGQSESVKYGAVDYQEGGLVGEDEPAEPEEGNDDEGYEFLFDEPTTETKENPYQFLHEQGMPNLDDYKENPTDFDKDLDDWKVKFFAGKDTANEDDESHQKAMEMFNSFLVKKNTAPVTFDASGEASTSGSLEQSIAARESGGNYQAYNPAGGGEGAVGKYQFRWTTHKPWIKAITGVQSMQEFMANPTAQEKAFQHWKNTTLAPTAQYLLPIAQKRFPGITANEIMRKVHFLGEGEAKRYFMTGKSNVRDAHGTTAATYGRGGEVSKLGYRYYSPFVNEPSLNIDTPTGEIDMSETPFDVKATQGDKQIIMSAGNPIPYRFNPGVVHEERMKQGGLTAAQYLTVRGLKDADDKGDFDNISPNKARKILHDKKLYGKPLTEEQRRLFGFLSKGHTTKYQQGGRTPIITNNPNDRRLQAYKDSMTLYNATKGSIDKIKSLSAEEWWAYTSAWNKNNPTAQPAGDRLTKLNKQAPRPIRQYTPEYREGDLAREYKKPVQPYIYQKPEPSLRRIVNNYPLVSEGAGVPSSILPNNPNINIGDIQPLPYRVEYDGTEHRTFATEQEGTAFQNELRNRPQGIPYGTRGYYNKQMGGPISDMPKVQYYDSKQIALLRAKKKQQFISEDVPDSEAQKAMSVAKKKAYVAQNPYAKLENGEIVQNQYDRDLMGVPYKGSAAAQIDKALDAAYYGIDAASYITAAGAMARAALRTEIPDMLTKQSWKNLDGSVSTIEKMKQIKQHPSGKDFTKKINYKQGYVPPTDDPLLRAFKKGGKVKNPYKK